MTGTIYDGDAGYTGNGGGSTACRITNDPLLVQAQNDLVTAYNDAAGRTPGVSYGAIDNTFGGKTLTTGVYAFGHAATANLTGTLTLDGGGDANSVFIFQASSDLITASSSVIALTNGAQACNVFWQVTSSVTLGSGSTFVGNIMALTAIGLNTGATIQGRALARNAAVTLDHNNISKSTCAAGSIGGASLTGGTTITTGTAVCPPITNIPPQIIESRRVDADSIFVSWGPYSGTNTFVVQYGTSSTNWLYSTNVTGFSTTLNGLPANQPIWVRVATKSSCAIGNYGASKLVGGPGLPNTGLASQKNNIPWVPVGIMAGISVLFVLIRRQHVFSSKS